MKFADLKSGDTFVLCNPNNKDIAGLCLKLDQSVVYVSDPKLVCNAVSMGGSGLLLAVSDSDLVTQILV